MSQTGPLWVGSGRQTTGGECPLTRVSCTTADSPLPAQFTPFVTVRGYINNPLKSAQPPHPTIPSTLTFRGGLVTGAGVFAKYPHHGAAGHRQHSGVRALHTYRPCKISQ